MEKSDLSLDPSINGLCDQFGRMAMVGDYVGCKSLYVTRISLPCCTLNVEAEYVPRTRQTWALLLWASVFGLVMLGRVGASGVTPGM